MRPLVIECESFDGAYIGLLEALMAGSICSPRGLAVMDC